MKKNKELLLRKGGTEYVIIAGIDIRLIYANIGFIEKAGEPLKKVPQAQLSVLLPGDKQKLITLQIDAEQTVHNLSFLLQDVYEVADKNGVVMEARIRVNYKNAKSDLK